MVSFSRCFQTATDCWTHFALVGNFWFVNGVGIRAIHYGSLKAAVLLVNCMEVTCCQCGKCCHQVWIITTTLLYLHG